MKKLFLERVITAIDIGTTKICVLIGKVRVDGSIELLGIARVPSEGLAKGVIVELSKAAESIKTAVAQAESMAKIKVESAYIGISGSHINSRSAFGAAPIEKGMVTQKDIDQAVAAARAVALPEGQQVLHVLPQSFSIDNQEPLRDPLGMYGIRLDVYIHMITGAIASVQNLVTACEYAGVQVEDVVLEQLASAAAVLNKDEQDLGVGVLDIGGGTSDLALYQKGTIRHTMVLPVAGNHFTRDLAVGLRISINDAERIKREYGLATSSLIDKDSLVEVEMVQGGAKQMVRLTEITNILEARAQELLALVHEEILSRRMEHLLVSGLVITGGGSLLLGMDYVAQDIFNVPVRIGTPHLEHTDPEILHNPIYATGYGLLRYAVENKAQQDLCNGGVARLFEKMKSWVTEFF